MSNLLHYFLITSLQTWNKTLARWLGKGGSANKKRTTFIVKYKVSKSFVWIETPRCWVADTEDLWAAHGPFYCCLTSLQLDMTPADKEGCQSVLFLDIIRSRIHSSATGKYSAIKGYDGTRVLPILHHTDKNSSAPLLRAWWAFESQYGQLRTLETSWLAETSVNAYCRNFIFPVLPALEHFLHFPKRNLFRNDVSGRPFPATKSDSEHYV